jgi:glutaredoxin-related protein
VEQKVGVQKGMELTGAMAEPGKPLEQRIKDLLSSAPAVLLMKGTPEEPKCGFSRRVVDALRKDNIDFKHVDILQVCGG